MKEKLVTASTTVSYSAYFFPLIILFILSVMTCRSIFLSILRYFPFLICIEDIHSGTSSIVKLMWASTSPGIDDEKIVRNHKPHQVLEDHWSCSSPERLSHCKLMRFKLIENRPMKVYAWTLLTPGAWPNLT